MIFLFIIVLILIGWGLSSVLGLIATIATYVTVYFFLRWFFKKMQLDVRGDGFADNVTTYAGLLFAGTVLLTTPIWDSKGFCDHQRESYEVAQSQTLEDVFKGRQRTETYYSDVSEACKVEGGWKFIGGSKNWRADVLLVLGIILGLAALVILGGIGFIGLELLKDVFRGGFRRQKNRRWCRSKSQPNSRKKITQGIGIKGREIISWEDCGEIGFDFYLANIDDIIDRKHLSKGDYDTWFHRCAKEYLDAYPEHNGKCTPSELASKLSWAVDHIDKIYAGKSEPVGAKKREKLQQHIERLSRL